MNPIRRGFEWCSKKTGLTVRMIFWSLFALIFVLLFTGLFTYPQNQRIKTLSAENEVMEAHLEEQLLLGVLDAKLNRVLKETYPDIGRINADAFEEEHLLELPSRIEQLAATEGVTLISINSSSMDDGSHVAIQATFQGPLDQLYNLLKTIGHVAYVKKLEAMTILALPDAEQMELKFTVPIK